MTENTEPYCPWCTDGIDPGDDWDALCEQPGCKPRTMYEGWDAVVANGFDFEAFVDGYIEALLWADGQPTPPPYRVMQVPDGYAVVGDGEPIITRESRTDAESECATLIEGSEWSDESGGREGLELRDGVRETLIETAQLREFVEGNLADLLLYCGSAPSLVTGLDESYAGHDFYLTRAGHGAGFWDRGLGELGDRLTEASKAAGSVDDHMLWDCGDGTVSL